MKSRDSRRIPLSCKYWWKGMAKSNYRKHKGRQRLDTLKDALLGIEDMEWLEMDIDYCPEDYIFKRK